MPSILLYIDILLYEHDAIRVHLKLAIKQITSDQTEADDGIAGKESQAVSFTRPGLETVISNLEDSLEHHFTFEEKVLQMLMEPHLNKIIQEEHQRISGERQKVRDLLATMEAEHAEHRIDTVVEDFCNLLKGHLDKEDVVLHMLRNEIAMRVKV